MTINRMRTTFILCSPVSANRASTLRSRARENLIGLQGVRPLAPSFFHNLSPFSTFPAYPHYPIPIPVHQPCLFHNFFLFCSQFVHILRQYMLLCKPPYAYCMPYCMHLKPLILLSFLYSTDSTDSKSYILS